MDLLIIPFVAFCCIIFSFKWNRVRKAKEVANLEQEIENDFIDEFANQASGSADSIELDEIVRWLEEQQMEEVIKKGST
jgi:hypothetical protein